MAAIDHLGPQFHGTVAALKRDDMIEPGHPANYEADQMQTPPGTHVFTSSSIDEAYGYARTAAGKKEDAYYEAHGKWHKPSFRPKVYMVVHTGPAEIDPEWNTDREEGDPPEPPRYRSTSPLQVQGNVTGTAENAYQRQWGERGY